MRYLIIILIVVNSGLTLAQKWDNIYGTASNNETFKDDIESYDHGYLISGSYEIPTSSNWLIKTDINGNVLWDKVILHNIHDVWSGYLDQNSSGEIVLSNRMVINSDTWPSVIKLDSCGNKEWCRVFVDDNYLGGAINDVILFENGDVLALGWLDSEEEIDKIFLYYIDSNGNLIWRQSYASKSDHPLVMERIGNSIRKFENEYIISGYCHYPFPSNPNTGYKRLFFIGIDTLFNEKWILPFAVNDTILGNAYNVITLNDSLFMGVGYKWQSSNPNSILMFFTSEGEELGYNQIYNDAIGPNVTYNITGDIARLNDTLFITTVTIGLSSGISPFGEFIIDTAANIFKIEQRTNTTWTSTIVKTFDDKYIIGCSYQLPNSLRDIYLYKINDSLEMDTVYPGNYTYDSLCPYQIQSGEIDISDCLIITDIGEVPTPNEYFASLNNIYIKAYPNPVKENQITFSFTNTEHLTPPSVPPQGGKPPHMLIYNIFGEKVYEDRIYRYQGESKVNVGDWNAGIYIAIIYSNNKVVGLSKFIVQ